jgi:NADH:ubiquinone oxidoreductase subunit C
MPNLDNAEADTSRADLAARLANIPGSAQAVESGGSLWISAPQLDVTAMARDMKAMAYRLITMTGQAGEGGETAIIYHYARREQYVSFKTLTRGGAIASVTPTLRMASWVEREIHDFFAVDFIGHPNLIPLLRSPGVKEGFFREAELSSTSPEKQ